MGILLGRCFLMCAALILFACPAAACEDGAPAPDPTPTFAPGATASFTHGVASGDVRSSSAVLWTRAEGGDNVAVELARDGAFGTIDHTAAAVTSAERDFTVKVKAEGLSPDTRYYYRFRAGDALSQAGSFTTAPAPNMSKPLRFVFSGDSDGTRRPDGAPPFNEFDVLRAAAAEEPAFFMYFGDTIYADRDPDATTLPAYRAKYRENRGYDALADILAQTSIITTWDDHEVVNDFASATVDRDMFEAGRRAYREYTPIDDANGEATLFNSFRWGADLDIIVLDERSYRSASAAGDCQLDGREDPLPASAAPDAPAALEGIRGFVGLGREAAPGCLEALDDPERTLLGEEQKAYLFDRLLHADATWKVVVNSVPIQALLFLPYDRWEGYAAERLEVLEFIRANQIKNVVFLTTDWHANIFGPVRVDPFVDTEPLAYEAIAGPIATTPLEQDVVEVIGEAGAGLLGEFLASIVGVDCAALNSYAYGLVEIDPDARTLTIVAKDETGAELCRKILIAA